MANRSLDEQSLGERFGVSLVNGFYGKGTWTGWCLLMASTIIDKLFTIEQDTAEKYAHICGLDINLVASFAYPFIAAVDLLLHMPHFFNNREVQDVDIARIDASLIVLREGMVCGFFLMLACAISSRKSKHKSRRLVVYFSGTCVLLFVIVNRVFDIGYCQFGWQSFVDGWVMMPYHRLFETPQSALAAKYLAFSQAFRKGNENHQGPPFWSIGLFVHTNLPAEIICKALLLRPGLFFNPFYAFRHGRKMALSRKLMRKNIQQRQTATLSEQTESYRDAGHIIDIPGVHESSRTAPNMRSDIELDDLSPSRNLEAQSPQQLKNQSGRERPPNIDEPERPRRPPPLRFMPRRPWLELLIMIHPTYAYLYIKLVDEIRPIFVTGPPIDWAAEGVSNIPPTGAILLGPILKFVICGTVLWQVMRALVDIVLSFAMMISHPASMVPIAEPKFKDLDQLGALITAGVLPLIYSIGGALNERFDVVDWIKDKLHTACVMRRKTVDMSRNF